MLTISRLFLGTTRLILDFEGLLLGGRTARLFIRAIIGNEVWAPKAVIKSGFSDFPSF